MSATAAAPDAYVMQVYTTTVDRYFGMWNETDPAQRANLIRLAWVEDGRYADPLLEAEGHDALDGMVAGVQQQFPGHAFRRSGEIDAHHDCLRFAWELVGPDGAVVVAGIDVAIVGSDGRLQSVTGFFGDGSAES
jgi:hypothetical protein